MYPYHYCRRRLNWAVYKWIDSKKISAVYVSEFFTKEAAKTECIKLNNLFKKSNHGKLDSM